MLIFNFMRTLKFHENFKMWDQKNAGMLISGNSLYPVYPYIPFGMTSHVLGNLSLHFSCFPTAGLECKDVHLPPNEYIMHNKELPLAEKENTPGRARRALMKRSPQRLTGTAI